MIYVYTSIANGWDNLRPPAVPIEDGVKFICYTNLPHLPRVHPWEYRPLYVVDPSQNARTSRIPKILPHLMLPEDAKFSIYHDGNFVLKTSPRQICDELLKDHDWMAHRHPCRNCIYQEADILLREKIGTGELVSAEISRYRAEGYPENNGLWANGFIARRHTPEVASLNELWWKLYAAGCERDQISFPVARAKSSVRVKTIETDIYYGSPVMVFRWHAAWKDREDNPDYWPERERLRSGVERLRAVVGPGIGVSYPEGY